MAHSDDHFSKSEHAAAAYDVLKFISVHLVAHPNAQFLFKPDPSKQIDDLNQSVCVLRIDSQPLFSFAESLCNDTFDRTSKDDLVSRFTPEEAFELGEYLLAFESEDTGEIHYDTLRNPYNLGEQDLMSAVEARLALFDPDVSVTLQIGLQTLWHTYFLALVEDFGDKPILSKSNLMECLDVISGHFDFSNATDANGDPFDFMALPALAEQTVLFAEANVSPECSRSMRKPL
jgi:hypothetical protein